MLVAEICLLMLIERQVEESANLAIANEFPLTFSHRVARIDPPKESAIKYWLRSFEYGKQINSVERMTGSGICFSGGKNRGGPIHCYCHLLCYAIGGHHTGPANDGRHTNPTFKQIAFPSRKWP